jgi:hypothetical protein
MTAAAIWKDYHYYDTYNRLQQAKHADQKPLEADGE